MDSLWTLSIFSLAMFLGCYIAGSIPLLLSLSETLLRKVTVFGAGLLIGTALVVIIPEGIESLYGGGQTEHLSHKEDSGRTIHDQSSKLEESTAAAVPSSTAGVSTHISEEHKESLQFLLGFSLIVGFVFMLVIDQLSSGSHSHASSTDVEMGSTTRSRRGGVTVTIGLVVHAAADGLALGAAAGLSKSDVEFVIFLAIMLHKAPAAFGFVSFLIHDGYDKRTARVHLLVFSLAAPVAAFISYFGLVRVMYITHVPITGVTMLFSAGTFLYVATVHVLNEVTHTSNSKLSTGEVILIATGSLLPLIFNFTHSH